MKSLGKTIGTLGIVLASYAPSLFGQVSAADSARYTPRLDTLSMGNVTITQAQMGKKENIFQSLRYVSNNQKHPIVADFDATPGKKNEVTVFWSAGSKKVAGFDADLVFGSGLSMDATEFEKGKVIAYEAGVVGKAGILASRKVSKDMDLTARLLVSGKIGNDAPMAEASVSGSNGLYSASATAWLNGNKNSPNVYQAVVERKVNARTSVQAGVKVAKFNWKNYSTAVMGGVSFDITKKLGFKTLKTHSAKVLR